MTNEYVQEKLGMSDGFDLSYRRWDASEEIQRVIVCIHGIGDHSGWFSNISPELAADGNQVYALDLRGFGSSKEKGSPRGYTIDFKRQLQDLDEALGQFRKVHHAKKIYVLGHSLGGVYCLWYAANHSDAVNGLILAAPAVVSTLNSRKSTVQLFFANLFWPRRVNNPYTASNSKGRDPEEIKIMLEDPLETNALTFNYLAHAKRALVDRAFIDASRIDKPTLILQGEADITVAPQGAQRLYARLKTKDKTLVTFPDAGHWFYDALSPASPRVKFSVAKREQLFFTVKSWLRSQA